MFMSIQISVSEITLKFDQIENVDLNQFFFRFRINLMILKSRSCRIWEISKGVQRIQMTVTFKNIILNNFVLKKPPHR